MKLKGIELKGAYKITYYDESFVVYDEKGNQIYFEKDNGYWARWKYNEKGNVICYENKNGCWSKSEYNEKGKRIYFKDSYGYWFKTEYDRRDNRTYYEDSYGYWFKSEYDEEDNEIYFEDSEGEVIDKRVKELTIEQIEKLLGYKIKIKGNESVDKNMNVKQEGADFYGATKNSEKADDILFALQVIYGQPKYTYRDFQKMNLSQTEINEALEYVEKKGYNKFSYFG